MIAPLLSFGHGFGLCFGLGMRCAARRVRHTPKSRTTTELKEGGGCAAPSGQLLSVLEADQPTADVDLRGVGMLCAWVRLYDISLSD